MKAAFICIAIIILFGSLTKRPTIIPCSDKIELKYFLKGKLIHTDVSISTKTKYGAIQNSDDEDGQIVYDSMVVKMYSPKINSIRFR